MNGFQIFIIVLSLIGLYVLIGRLMLDRAEPYRMRLADLGKTLLSSPRLTENEKRAVDGMLDDAFDWTVAVRLCMRVPFVIFRHVLGSAPKTSMPDHPDFHEFLNCYMKSIFFANPVFSILMRLEIGLILLFAITLFGVFSQLSKIYDAVSQSVIFGEHQSRHRHKAAAH